VPSAAENRLTGRKRSSVEVRNSPFGYGFDATIHVAVDPEFVGEEHS